MSRISSLICFVLIGLTLFLFPILPYSLSVRHADAATSITLAWDPNSEPDLAGYKLYYGTAKGAYEFAFDVGNQTTCTIPGFLEGADYHFAVTAYNTYGLESAFSDEVSYPGPIAVTLSFLGISWYYNTPCPWSRVDLYETLSGYLPGVVYDYSILTDIGDQTSHIFVGDSISFNLGPISGTGIVAGRTFFSAWGGDWTLIGISGTIPSGVPWAGADTPQLTLTPTTGLNLISLPIEPLNPSIAALTGQLSPCLRQVLAYTRDAEGNDSWLYYDPSQLDQSTLSTMEAGKGYWFEMACPGEMTVVGNRTTKPVTLIPGLNLVGYNSLTPLPVLEALSSIANNYTSVWAYEGDQWIFYDPTDETASTLKVLKPGSGYFIEGVTEETTWTLPYSPYQR
jgi:hypothetical protein